LYITSKDKNFSLSYKLFDMKKLIFLLLITLYFSADVSGQVGIEAQIGGANFFGLTVNSRFKIPLSKSHVNSLSPTIGVGILAPWWDQPTAIINAGITYNHKSLGIGTEISGFTDNPFVASSIPRDFVDVIVYPNLNYTFSINQNWYVRLSGGAYFAFSKFTDLFSEKVKLKFEGDVIPGAGIGIGYLIK
jgi:hypothetical protein